MLAPKAPPKLGGNWFSLIAVHLGGVLLWLGIFLRAAQLVLHGAAYGLWFASMLPLAYEVWQIVRTGFAEIAGTKFEPPVLDSPPVN
ncbi:MAG: hypothetical protein IPK17_16000 [Chloroflexi bacterium]|uniref:hypothetical protein n=1 Tax=Candidatus Flexifilum breve TaxID=3140694 RepID=UPI0031356BAF|nr:hypothetical protein [Chloroflexota bacterium]